MCFITTKNKILFSINVFPSCISVTYSVDFCEFISYHTTGMNSFITSNNFLVISLNFLGKPSCSL